MPEPGSGGQLAAELEVPQDGCLHPFTEHKTIMIGLSRSASCVGCVDKEQPTWFDAPGGSEADAARYRSSMPASVLRHFSRTNRSCASTNVLRRSPVVVGRSTARRCAAGERTDRREPAMLRFNSSAIATGVAGSSRPAITVVGTRMPDRRGAHVHARDRLAGGRIAFPGDPAELVRNCLRQRSGILSEAFRGPTLQRRVHDGLRPFST